MAATCATRARQCDRWWRTLVEEAEASGGGGKAREWSKETKHSRSDFQVANNRERRGKMKEGEGEDDGDWYHNSSSRWHSQKRHRFSRGDEYFC